MNIKPSFSLPDGVCLIKEPSIKAYSVEYRSEPSVSAVIYYAKSRGQALSAWMKENHEYDYFECSAMLSIRRAPQADIFRCVITATPAGQALQERLSTFGFIEKLSLLQFCGVSVRNLYYLLERNLRIGSSARHKAQAVNATCTDACLGAHTGWVRAIVEEPPLFDPHGDLTAEYPLTYFPQLSYRGLSEQSQALSMLVLQDVMDHLSRKIPARFWLYFSEKRLDEQARTIQQCQTEQPRFFHKMWARGSDHTSIAALPCLIYSGQWGMYWRDTSGYSNSRDKCRAFTIKEALAQTHHCGSEKGINIALLSAEEIARRNLPATTESIA